MDSSPPGSSVHGIVQARILEWVAISSSRGSSWLRDQTHVSWFVYHWHVDSLSLCYLESPILHDKHPYKKTVFAAVFKMDNQEKEMATHSSILAWRIPWMEEPGGLQSMGSQRVGYDWATSLSLSTLSWEDFQLLCLLLIVFLSSQRPVTIFFLGCLFFNCITLHTVV